MEDIKARPTTHTNNGGEEQPVDLETQRFGSQYKSKEEVEKLEGRSLTDTEYEELKKKYPHTSKPEETSVTPKMDLKSLMDKSTKDGILKFLAQKQTKKYAISLQNFESTRDGLIKRYRKIISDEKIRKWNETFNRLMENSDFCMRVDVDGLLGILKDNKFKNQIELKIEKGVTISHGYRNPAYRAEFSQEKFGTLLGTSPYDNLKPFSDAEKYGFIAPKDMTQKVKNAGGEIQYGDCVFTFKNDIKHRTTYTIGDSLSGDRCPKYVGEGFDEFVMKNESDVKMKLNDLTGLDQMRNIFDLRERLLSRATLNYVEAQYHGEVTLDDVSSLSIPPSYLTNGTLTNILKKMKEKGYNFKIYSTDKSDDTVKELSFDERGNYTFVK